MHLILNSFLISYAATFLTFYPGAQPTAMGGVFCGIADNAYASFYNPAGLAFQREIDFAFEYASIAGEWNTPPKYWNFSGVISFNPKISFGIFGSGTYSRVISPSFPRDTTSSIWELAPGLSFGYELNYFLGLGVNLKYIRSPIWSMTGSSFAVDLGILTKHSFPFGKVCFGFSALNIGPEMIYNNTERVVVEELPFAVKAGFSYSISGLEVFKKKETGWFRRWFYEKWRVIIAYDVNVNAFSTNPWHSFGIEIRLISFLPVRGGYFANSHPIEWVRRSGFTWGIGFDFKFLRFDMSDNFSSYPFDPSHRRFSLSLNIGEPIFSKNGLSGR
jgi:hypothetical protein